MTQAVVLCGGYGTRMGDALGDRQKCLAPVGGRPFLGHVLDLALTKPVDRVLLLTSHHSEQVDDFVVQYRDATGFERVTTMAEPVPRGPIAALRSAVEYLDEEFLLLLGDVLPPPGTNSWRLLSAVAAGTGADAVMMTAPRRWHHQPGNVVAEGARVVRYQKGLSGPLTDRGVRYLRRSALRREATDDQQFFGALAEEGRLAQVEVDLPITEVGSPGLWAQAQRTLGDA